ncbi:uncharacterized protein KY384_005173 [Bacidia gigantensis]|uniref:uncharacterized protein n=1 Tax=Bacidia gigantensis TaxID=2732470 RepID=UPI001D046CDA|nr:uncharacterized protein KY384_005173 [Bacidia gigantensis]KAG8529692.1 hypothetical protein KY384_005173 [Bacidia gigantensis]
MSSNKGTQHQGLYIEAGSGGFLTDLTFYGGLNAAVFGNQQFTMRNMAFYNSVTAIKQVWNWGWTYKSITVQNCTTGLDMTNGGPSNQAVGSVVWLDSTFKDTKVAFSIARTDTSSPNTGGSLSIENVALNNVGTAVLGPNNAIYLAGITGQTTITGWKTGNTYNPTALGKRQGGWTPPTRPASLLVNGKYYERSKPQYETLPVTSFLSARSSGAKGDGNTDDTTALQNAINSAVTQGKVLFVDAGTYVVRKTILIPAGSKIVGESYSVILSSGTFFSDINAPQPVVQVGNAGDTGVVEWSDMIVSTRNNEIAQAGAILIKWNLASTSSSPSGMWDVHTRIGGFKNSWLNVADCPTTPSSTAINTKCIAAYMSMWITKSAAALYMENVWLWVADHDVEDPNLSQITVYAGRGLYIESTAGTFWLVGTAVEHHTLYQYQVANTKNIFMGQIQTETPYYQPNPAAPAPFNTVNSAINDPNFATYCPAGSPTTCFMAWGLRIVASNNIFVLGAGLYSFFNNYNTACNALSAGSNCQTAIFTYDNAGSMSLFAYNLNTVGSVSMVNRDNVVLAKNVDNRNNFPSTINLFRSQG